MKKFGFYIMLIICLFSINGKIYAYKSYKIGDIVSYKGIDFYVIKDSSSTNDNIVLLKSKSLSYDEVKSYANKINEELANKVLKMPDIEYGFLPYLTVSNCGEYVNGQVLTSNCSTDYNTSNIKKIVDLWVDEKLEKSNLVIDNGGNYARLLNKIDLFNDLKYEIERKGIDSYSVKENNNISGFINDYAYWTMIPAIERENAVMQVDMSVDGNGNTSGIYRGEYIYDTYNVAAIRPVITLKKNSIEIDENNSSEGKSEEFININKNDTDKSETKTKVSVPNTLKSVSGLVILVGLVLVCAGLNIFIIIKNKDRKKD